MKKKLDYIDIANEVNKRGIKHLVHFTPTINLMSIIEQQALISRAGLESLGIEQFDVLDYVQFTDSIRYDDKNYINLSITTPNKFLFKRFRDRTKDDPTLSWCILLINIEPVYWQDTLFSVTNAASRAAQSYGINGSVETFKKMFSSELMTKQKIFRAPNYPDNQTTDFQAEVLVKDRLSLEYIEKVCFSDEESKAATLAALSFLDFDESIFIADDSLFF